MPVTPELDREVEVHLDLPAAQQSGLGTTIEAADQGMRIAAVRTGSAAATAGFRPGDVIVSVNGTRAAGIDPDEFGALTRGDVGGTITLQVLVDDVLVERTVTRTFLSSGRIPVLVDTPNGTGERMEDDPNAWVR